MNKTTININGKEIDLDSISSKETKVEEKTIFYRESAIQSIISDTYSFIFLAVTFWFNYNYIGGNNWIDFLLIVMFISLLSSKFSGRKREFTSKKEIIDFINKELK